MTALHKKLSVFRIFLVVCCFTGGFYFDAFADATSCFGTDSGEVYNTPETVTGLPTVAEMTTSGVITVSGSTWTPVDIPGYIAGQEWKVKFGDSYVTGYAGCTATGWKTTQSYAKPSSVNAGCACALFPGTGDNGKWYYSGTNASGADRTAKSENCRATCPYICANKFATDSSFRTKLLGSADCPLVPLDDDPGNDEPVEVHCNDGQYLPGGAKQCSSCDGIYYCTEDTYYTSDQPQGLKTCPVGQEPNAYHTGCVNIAIQCPAGTYLPAHSTSSSDCTECIAGTFCPGVNDGVYDDSDEVGYDFCPDNSESDDGASYCTCETGFSTDGYPQNSSNIYTTDTACIQAVEPINCSAGTYLPAYSTSSADCTTCPSGYFCDGASNVMPGSDSAVGLHECPTNSNSNGGTSYCTCVTGYSLDAYPQKESNIYTTSTQCYTITEEDPIECTGTGTIYDTQQNIDIVSSADLEDLGVISGSGTSWKVNNGMMEDYIDGGEWHVVFNNHFVTGYSGCGARGATLAKSPYSNPFYNSAYSGCMCSFDKINWYSAGALDGGASDWTNRNQYCRANCAYKCAETFADSGNALRDKMINGYGGDCPLVPLDGDSGDEPETHDPISCPAGTYLPAHSTSSSDCDTCIGGTFCTGFNDGVYDDTDEYGYDFCPEHAESDDGASYCTCETGYTTDGNVPDASNTTTTSVDCVPVSNTDIYEVYYVCDEDSGNFVYDDLAETYNEFTFAVPDENCTKPNSVFVGWSDGNGNTYEAGETITWNYDSEMVFTAVWDTAPTHTVYYNCGSDATGGYAPSPDYYVIQGADYTTKSNTCEKYGYEFLGWEYNDSDIYGEIETFTYNYDSDITLTPMWSGITINCNAGYYIGTNEITCNNTCPANSYCPGGQYTYNGEQNGITSCMTAMPSWATSNVSSPASSTNVDDCTVVIPSGKYATVGSLNNCQSSFYCPGYTGTKTAFLNELNGNSSVGLYHCADAVNYEVWDSPWLQQLVTSPDGATDASQCRIYVPAGEYVDIEGNINNCISGYRCPGETYTYNQTDDFFENLTENEIGVGIYACDEYEVSSSDGTYCESMCQPHASPNGNGGCDCDPDYKYRPTNGSCVLACGAGRYSPDDVTCTDVGAHYWSPNNDNNRYECDAGLTTAGYGIGADEAGDCGKILHIGNYALHLSSDKRVFGAPVLHVRIGDYLYYANMTTDETPMNDSTDKTLRVKYNDTVQYIYDITME